jgi:hypothetical protein
VALALAGDFLMRDIPWGINAALWMGLLTWGAVLHVGRDSSHPMPAAALRFFLAAGCFAFLFALRDAPSAQFICALAAGVCLLYGLAITQGFAWRDTGLPEFIARGFEAAGVAAMLAGEQAATSHVRPAKDVTARFGLLLRGILLAVPFLIIFMILFARADARFMNFFDQSFDPTQIVGHLLALGLSALFAWIMLVGVARRRKSPTDVKLTFEDPAWAMGAAEVSIAVGMISLLFLVFVSLQAGYLFGGVEYLMKTAQLTAADYGRSGFYELVTAAAIVLGTVYFFDWLARDSAPASRRILYWLVRGLLILTVLVLLSAVHRMQLYVQMFGLSEQRLMTFIFMGWLTLLFVWSEATILRGRRARFASGALVSALMVAMIFPLINPHAMIASVNLKRLAEGKRFDLEYAETLSNDTLPILVEHHAVLPPAEQKWLSSFMEKRRASLDNENWRSWNFGDVAANIALESRLRYNSVL